MVLLVVGDSISGREALRWFDTRPLSGRRILVTRTADQGKKTVGMLRERGADPILVPTITIGPPEDPARVARAARELASYAWVAFTSENGVRAFFDALAREGLDARAFGTSRVAVIGPGTATALAEHGLRADVVAKEFRGEGLAKAMLEALGGAKGKRVLIARAKQAREALPEALSAGGCEVDVVPVYETHPAPGVSARITGMLDGRELDALTFTSASTVHAFCDALGDNAPALVAKSGAIVASIGPITTEAAIARGLEVHATAAAYTIEGLVAALELAFTRRPSS
jgi:uroporphyrinogen III methyltransferase/synthase